MQYWKLMSDDKARNQYITDIDQELSSIYKEYYDGFSSKEKELIKKYTGFYFKKLNGYLCPCEDLYGTPSTRLKDRFVLKRDINCLNHLINSMTLTKPLTLYRGTSIANLKKTSIITDSTIRNLTIYSTSLDPKVATNFSHRIATNNGLGGTEVIIEFDLPEKFPILYLEPFSISNKEYEVLINNDSLFEIVEEDYYEGDFTKKKILRVKPIL